MPSVDETSPNATPLPITTNSRRILSRIRSPFAPKTKNITNFSVEVCDPHRQHSPGDLVTGFVRLQVNKPVRVTHLVVCLHGFVQVFKNPGSPGENYRTHGQYLANGRPKKSSGEYFGNGFASLFEDEVVLCGDGRLAEGTYQFNFELEFPDRDLPSSIDFERGTISYMITATLTRPTPISPTISCDRKIYLVERIDISPLAAPQIRTITLEPVSKRSRAKTQARKLVDSNRRTDSQNPSDEMRRSPLPAGLQTNRARESSGSASPSEMSLDSLVSSNGLAQQSDSQHFSFGTGASDHSKKSAMTGKTITASVEMQNGGCLRGDNISIKVHIDHSKAIKSVHGVIVTLYRSARVDLHPAIPLGPREKGTTAKYEDYYPKSLTGLGGLSLSGAGSSHNFRKDLTQTLAPLYVDPQTLTADITAKVRVPEGAFPSIATVPGSMISFKYYVEVILDIQGKLSSQDRSIGNLGGLATAQNQLSSLSPIEINGTSTTPFAPPIIDTAQIRRDKAVVGCTFEVIVGTQDSERRKGKAKAETKVESEPVPKPSDLRPSVQQQPSFTGSYDQQDWYDEPDAHHESYWQTTDQYQYDGYGHNDYDAVAGRAGTQHEYHYSPLPIPEMPEESQLSEKERMRRMEERLLPSQPPEEWGPSSSGGSALQASAPYLEEELSALGMHVPSAPAYEASAPSATMMNGYLSVPSTPIANVHGASPMAFVPADIQPSSSVIFQNGPESDNGPLQPSSLHDHNTHEVNSGGTDGAPPPSPPPNITPSLRPTGPAHLNGIDAHDEQPILPPSYNQSSR